MAVFGRNLFDSSAPTPYPLPCGITRGNNNIIGLIVAKIPERGDFNFNSVYNSISQKDFNEAHGHIGSWASPVTGGLEMCYQFLKGEEFLESTLDRLKSKLTESGRILKDKGDYENYVNFIISEKNRIDQLEKEGHRLAHRQSILAERQVWINIWIAVGVSIAAVYYLFQLYDGQPLPHPCAALYTLCITVGAGILALALKALQKHKDKQT